MTQLSAQQVSDVIKTFPAAQRERGNLLIDRLRRVEQEKVNSLDRLLPLLEQGDAIRGRDIFLAEKSKCATCHRVGTEGKAVGPDLTTIGANRAAADLLESILFPSATIVRDYETYTVVLEDGRTFSGLIVRQSSDTIELQLATGQKELLPREEIEELISSEISIMPAGLEKELTEQELADLVAFLISLKQASATGKTPDE